MTDEIVFPSSPAGGKSSSPPLRTGDPALLAVALVGFMGAGKTTVGRALAARIGWRFHDLDERIEQRERRTIEDIFRQDGEPAFRRLEVSLLRELVDAVEPASVVLALGGGAFAEPSVQQCLDGASIPAVFLDAPAGELFRRCEQPGVERPLRRDLKPFRELYERRRPAYLKAHLHIETGGKPVAVVVEEIISGLNLVAKPVPRSSQGSGECE